MGPLRARLLTLSRGPVPTRTRQSRTPSGSTGTRRETPRSNGRPPRGLSVLNRQGTQPHPTRPTSVCPAGLMSETTPARFAGREVRRDAPRLAPAERRGRPGPKRRKRARLRSQTSIRNRLLGSCRGSARRCPVQTAARSSIGRGLPRIVFCRFRIRAASPDGSGSPSWDSRERDQGHTAPSFGTTFSNPKEYTR
jgi:hypothetical protein